MDNCESSPPGRGELRGLHILGIWGGLFGAKPQHIDSASVASHSCTITILLNISQTALSMAS